VFVIDNSSSMDEELREIEERINSDFANIIGSSGIDYRVIMLSRYLFSGEHTICIRAPLGKGDCAEGSELQNNPPRFFHYSTTVSSTDAWCRIFKSWTEPDESLEASPRPWTPLAPKGLSSYLRPEAFKHFVVISDDGLRCTLDGVLYDDLGVRGVESAKRFDDELLKLAPEQFGTKADRRYRWHSIVGLAQKEPPNEPWLPSEPVQITKCGEDVVTPGTGHQLLSKLSGGLRYPICRLSDYDKVFRAIAQSVITGAKLSCSWSLPAPPTGESFDANKVNVRYTAEGTSVPIIIGKVPTLSACDSRGGWYYDNADSPRAIMTCPSTCETLKGDALGRIEIAFGCATQNMPR
jgi:hypothetical protein